MDVYIEQLIVWLTRGFVKNLYDLTAHASRPTGVLFSDVATLISVN